VIFYLAARRVRLRRGGERSPTPGRAFAAGVGWFVGWVDFVDG